MEKMMDLSLKKFCQSVASDSFAPGGGCVSAFSGALSASLAKMVLNLTIGKKKYLEFDEENRKILHECEKISSMMIECVERDIDGCNQILQAMSLPKETDTEKARRKLAMSEASKKANEAPLKVCELSLALLRIFNGSFGKVNRNTITDWACGALQAYSALEGAAMNAKINCGSIDDQKYCRDVENTLRETLGEGRKLFENLKNQVHSSLDASH